MEKLARYIIRAFFSQERMSYLPGGALAKTGQGESDQVEYRSKDSAEIKVFMDLLKETDRKLKARLNAIADMVLKSQEQTPTL